MSLIWVISYPGARFTSYHTTAGICQILWILNISFSTTTATTVGQVADLDRERNSRPTMTRREAQARERESNCSTGGRLEKLAYLDIVYTGCPAKICHHAAHVLNQVLSPTPHSSLSDNKLYFEDTVRFCHFRSAFRIEIDESFLRFFSLTLDLVDSILLLDV